MIERTHPVRNDVSIPPEDSDALDAPIGEDHRKQITTTPIPPPDKLLVDVKLYDHPNFLPTGAGNFWLLGMIGIALIGVMLVMFWMLKGLMR